MLLISLLVFVLIVGALAYHRVKLSLWSGAVFVLLLLYSIFSHHHWFPLSVLWLLFFILIVPINIIPFRRKFISQKIFHWYRKVMPTMSRTEKEALEAGTV